MAGFWLFSSDGLPGRDACAVVAVGGARGCARACVHVDGCGCACGCVGSGVVRVREAAGVLCSCLCPFAGACGWGWFSDCVVVGRVGVLHDCLAGAPVVDRAGSCVGVFAGCSSVVSGVFSGVSCSGVVFSCGDCGSVVFLGVFSVGVGFCGHCLPCGFSDGCGRFGACGCSYGAAGISACRVVCVSVLVCVSAPVLVIGRACGRVSVGVWSVVLPVWLVSVSVLLSVSVAGCWMMAVVPVSALACPLLLMRGCWSWLFGLPLCMYGMVSGSAAKFMFMFMFMFMTVVVAASYMVMSALPVPVCALAGASMFVSMSMVDVLAGLGAGLLRLVASSSSRGGSCGVLPVEDGASAVLYSPADAGWGSWAMTVLRAYMGMCPGMGGDAGRNMNGYAGCGGAAPGALSDHGSVPLWTTLSSRLLRRFRADADMRMDMGMCPGVVVAVVANMETAAKDEGIAAGADACTCEQAGTADADGISAAAGACSGFHDSIRVHASTCATPRTRTRMRMRPQSVDTRMTAPEGGR